MTWIDNITTDPLYQELTHPITTNNIRCIGLFPYETKRVHGIHIPKVSDTIYDALLKPIRQCIHLSNLHFDNKIVLVFEDIRDHDYFALFLHDNGAKLGNLDDIFPY